MGVAITVLVTLEEMGPCWKCGIHYAMPSDLKRRRREDGGGFFCPNGHEAVFGKTEVERLKEELATKQRSLDAANARATVAENSAKAFKGKVTEIKNRVGNGVCPCCNRSFTNLRRHMHTKHPDYKKGEP